MKNKILIADDDAEMLETLSSMLEAEGYTVIRAENGEEAVAQLDQHAFDLLLVDLKMPGMDGMQVVAAARARQPDIAVIVLTGHGSLDSAIEGLHHGIFDYLLKTTEPPKVIERVKAALTARAVPGRASRVSRGSASSSSPGVSAENRVIQVGRTLERRK